MAAGLKNVGFLDWFAKSAGGSLVSLDPTMAVLGLLLAFCLLRYFFASGTAYVTAMVGLFATLILQIPGVDPAQVMLILLVPMGIMGILTPYGTGHSPIWFASGYNKGPEFLEIRCYLWYYLPCNLYRGGYSMDSVRNATFRISAPPHCISLRSIRCKSLSRYNAVLFILKWQNSLQRASRLDRHMAAFSILKWQ